MTRWLAVAFVALTALVLPRPAAACSCLRISVAEALAQADAVFMGRVVSIQAGKPLKPGWQSTADPLLVTLDVSGSWKGRVGRMTTVTTAQDGSSCGVSFQKGQQYVVYATQAKDGLSTGLCSRTGSVPEATDDLKSLGAAATVPPKP